MQVTTVRVDQGAQQLAKLFPSTQIRKIGGTWISLTDNKQNTAPVTRQAYINFPQCATNVQPRLTKR